jgi:hypothetical protein
MLTFRRNLFSGYKWEAVGFSKMLELTKPHDIISQEIITYSLITYVIATHSVIFFATATCSIIRGYQYFAEEYCFHLHGQSSTNFSEHTASIFWVEVLQIFETLKAVWSSKTLLPMYETIWCHTP